MSVLFILLPLALVASAIAVVTFCLVVRSGQMDDLDTPPWRILFDRTDRPEDDADASSRASRSRE